MLPVPCGATATMYDVLSWGGETQALIYNPKTKKVIGIMHWVLLLQELLLNFIRKRS
jgi:hypothetical protein